MTISTNLPNEIHLYPISLPLNPVLPALHWPTCRDAQYFRAPSRPATQSPDSWILRFNSLKRLYRLITQYLTDVLRQPATSLEVPDLQAIAKEYNAPETLRLCRLALAVAVQTAKNKDIIARIQGLKEVDQSALMRAIEEVSGQDPEDPLYPF